MIEEMSGDFFQWLRGFYFVAQRGSVTQGAMEMGRNQPTVSHQIKCLEEAFGVTLFDRSKGKMLLTPEGEAFLKKTISVFEIIKEIKSEIGTSQLEHQGSVVIATTHAIIHYFLPQFIVNFRERHPNVSIEIEGGGLEMILGKIESAEADFGIANLEKVPEGLLSYDLFETELKLIAPKKNGFKIGKSPTLHQISEAPFICFPGSSTITPLIKRRFEEEGLELNEVLCLNNYESVKKYVTLGQGTAILDDYAITESDRERLNIFPLDRFFNKRTYRLILRKRKYLPPAAMAFIRFIKPDTDLT
jgi:DNA-binding transcriptional LysR family regulator